MNRLETDSVVETGAFKVRLSQHKRLKLNNYFSTDFIKYEKNKASGVLSNLKELIFT